MERIEYVLVLVLIAYVDVKLNRCLICHPDYIVEMDSRLNAGACRNPRIFGWGSLGMEQNTLFFCALQQLFPKLQAKYVALRQLLLLLSKTLRFLTRPHY